MERVTNTIKNAIYGDSTNTDQPRNTTDPEAHAQRSGVGQQTCTPDVTSDTAVNDYPSGEKYSQRDSTSSTMRNELNRDSSSHREGVVSEDSSNKDIAGVFRSHPSHQSRLETQNFSTPSNDYSPGHKDTGLGGIGTAKNASQENITSTTDSNVNTHSGSSTPTESKTHPTESKAHPIESHHSTESSTYRPAASLTSSEEGLPPGPTNAGHTQGISGGAASGIPVAAPSMEPGVGATSTSHEPPSALGGALGNSGPATATEPSVSAPPTDNAPSTSHQGEHQPLARPDGQTPRDHSEHSSLRPEPESHHQHSDLSTGSESHLQNKSPSPSDPRGPTGIESPSGTPLPTDKSKGEGSGTKYERSSGLAADGGDFDATRPGAGREADRLLDEAGIGHGGKEGDHPTPAPKSGKPSVGEKIKEKLHIKKH